MNNEMMNEILKRLDAMAVKVGEGAAYMWKAMVRQQFFVNGVLLTVVYTLLFVAAIVATIYIVRWVKGVAKRLDGDGYFEDGEMGLLFGACIVTLIIYGLALYNITSSIAHIVNPSYYALMDLAKMVGK